MLGSARPPPTQLIERTATPVTWPTPSYPPDPSPPTSPLSIMSFTYNQLADIAKEKLFSSHKERILITISGIPGSGKSTAAAKITEILNNDGIPTSMVPMDGFHLYRHELDKMNDPIEAHRRRGAPFTFDADKLVVLIKLISQSYGTSIKAPAFDHKKKDPSPDEIVISGDSKIVIIEGLYLLLSDSPWNQIGPLIDEKWFLEVDLDIARERVAKRHVMSGITSDIESGRERFDMNDAPNGIYLSTHSIEPDLTIREISSE